MTDSSSRKKDKEPSEETHAVGWLLPLFAIFPFVALVTYDWHAVAALNLPPAPSANWIGALGDFFAYWGYKLVGLAIWLVPVLCIIGGTLVAVGHRLHTGKRKLWLLVFIAAAACLLESTAADLPGVERILVRVNTETAGGIVGYLLMKRFLIPLIGGFGATIAMSVIAVITLITVIGLGNLCSALSSVWRWSLAGISRKPLPPIAGDADDEARYEREQAAYLAALKAREDAAAQAKAEKERIRAEKEAARAAKKAEREAEEAEREALKERIRAEREATKERLRQEQEAARERLRQEQEQERDRAAAAAADRPADVRPANTAAPTTPVPGPEEPEDKGPYLLPGVNLLSPLKVSAADHSDVDVMSARIINTLKLYKVDATLSFTVKGPVITKYAIKLAEGTPYSSVTKHELELMGALHAKSLRIEAPIPGKEEVGIEVPNTKPAGISFREIFESETWKTANAKMELPLLFGKDASGKELVADLASMPHMLVAGATGQGKSVCLNSLLCGLLMTRTPEQLKLIMVDPKSVEFAAYSRIPHLLIPVIADNNKVVKALQWAVVEMEKRLKLFTRAHVRNIYDFNHRKSVTQTDMFGADTEIGSGMPKTLPYIVVIIDEVADLMMQCAKVVTPPISRIAAKARAAGIHLILATQRPDAKIITGSIKANIPGRVAFKTASSVDSRTILDDSGAENLIGRGDMLFKGKDGILTRAQGSWISDEEIANVTSFIEEHSNLQYDDKFAKNLARVQEAGVEDPFADMNEEDAKATKAEQREQIKAAESASDFKKAVECVINTKRASVSHFQRQMSWGYNHAAKILDELTARGVVAPQEGMGSRRIIMDEDAMIAILHEGEAGNEVENQGEGGEAGEDFPSQPETDDATDLTTEG